MDKQAEIQKYIVSGQGMNFRNLRSSISGNSVYSYGLEIGRIDRNSRTVALLPKEGWILSHTTRKHINMLTRAVTGLQGWTMLVLTDPVVL